jgi:chemotaxis signal transduction protein
MTITKFIRRQEPPEPSAETILLFSLGPYQLGISADALQEIRSDRGRLSGEATDMPVVSARGTLGAGKETGDGLLVLRRQRVAVRVDKVERITKISALHPLPQMFFGREREWYRGLALNHEDVVPVLNPDAFLSTATVAAPPSEAAPSARQPIPVSGNAVAGRQTFVIFPLGARQYALPVDVVAHLSRPGWVQIFPHTTPGLVGVMVRMNHIFPVWDIMPMLAASEAPSDKFYLVARRFLPRGEEWAAIPVSGACEMLQSEMLPPADDAPPFVRGSLRLPGDEVQCLDLERLAQAQCQLSGTSAGRA